MFGSCESSISFDSGNINGSDNDFFFCLVFSRHEKIMTTSDTEPKDIKDFKSIYISEEIIASFRQYVNLYSSSDEE